VLLNLQVSKLNWIVLNLIQLRFSSGFLVCADISDYLSAAISAIILVVVIIIIIVIIFINFTLNGKIPLDMCIIKLTVEEVNPLYLSGRTEFPSIEKTND
jgi:hypothetical protein